MHCTEEPEEWLFEARILRRTEKNLPTQDHCSWQESQFFFPVVPPPPLSFSQLFSSQLSPPLLKLGVAPTAAALLLEESS